MHDAIVFLQEFLKHPRQVASVIPSSRFLERRIVDLAEIRSARTIVELGAGTGGTTRAILAAMPADARLLIIDINPQFCTLVRRIGDPRLIVHCGSANEIAETVSRYRLPEPDAIVSGIPFSTIGSSTARAILEAIATLLVPGGRFLAYQVSNRVAEIALPVLGRPRVEGEIFNIPPIRLYRWEKRLNGHAHPAAAASRVTTP